MDTVLQELRYAVRTLAAIHSVVDTTLLRLAFLDPGQLMKVSLTVFPSYRW